MKNKKELAVLYIITKLELGGAQKVCLSLLNGIENNNNVYLISGKKGILTKNIVGKKNAILLDSFEREVFSPLLEIKNFVRLIQEIKKIKIRHKDLIVHTHSTKAGIIGRWAAYFAGVKHIVHTVHGYAFHSHQNKLAWTLIYAAELFSSLITDHFVCVSSFDVKLGIKLFPRFKRKHSIVRAAADWGKFSCAATKTSPFPPKEKPFVFGTTSCFKPQKNLLDLFKAFEIVSLKNPNIKLELIGDGEMRNTLQQWVKEKKLESKIFFHGWQDDIAPIMQNWHAFTLSSLWEGLPCAIVEARILNLPVLCYNTGGIRDLISNKKNGFLFEQGDWKNLAQGMINISQNKLMHKKMQIHEDNLDEFKTEYMVQKHIELYRNF